MEKDLKINDIVKNTFSKHFEIKNVNLLSLIKGNILNKFSIEKNNAFLNDLMQKIRENVSIQIDNQEYLPNKNLIIIPNHPRTNPIYNIIGNILGKYGISFPYHLFLLGEVMKELGYQPIMLSNHEPIISKKINRSDSFFIKKNRFSQRMTNKEEMNEYFDKLSKNKKLAVIIFPEGTAYGKEKIGMKLYTGFNYIAQKINAVIVPTRIDGMCGDDWESEWKDLTESEIVVKFSSNDYQFHAQDNSENAIKLAKNSFIDYLDLQETNLKYNGKIIE